LNPPHGLASRSYAASQKRAEAKNNVTGDRVPITLRPPKALLERYTYAAADRSREIGRVVSAQEIMLEQLERGPS